MVGRSEAVARLELQVFVERAGLMGRCSEGRIADSISIAGGVLVIKQGEQAVFGQPMLILSALLGWLTQFAKGEGSMLF